MKARPLSIRPKTKAEAVVGIAPRQASEYGRTYENGTLPHAIWCLKGAEILGHSQSYRKWEATCRSQK